jgi:hypothetical protein
MGVWVGVGGEKPRAVVLPLFSSCMYFKQLFFSAVLVGYPLSMAEGREREVRVY